MLATQPESTLLILIITIIIYMTSRLNYFERVIYLPAFCMSSVGNVGLD